MSAVFLVERRSSNQKLEKCHKRDRYNFASNYAPIWRVLCFLLLVGFLFQGRRMSEVTEKLLPNRPLTSFRSRFDAIPLQNVGDCGVGEDVAQIGERPLNPPITPASILLGHSSHQRSNLVRYAWSP